MPAEGGRRSAGKVFRQSDSSAPSAPGKGPGASVLVTGSGWGFWGRRRASGAFLTQPEGPRAALEPTVKTTSCLSGTGGQRRLWGLEPGVLVSGMMAGVSRELASSAEMKLS